MSRSRGAIVRTTNAFRQRPDLGHPLGSRSMFVVTGNIGIWRPYGIAEMLDLKVAAPLPDDYANLLDTREHTR
jgi:hypothetical protein